MNEAFIFMTLAAMSDSFRLFACVFIKEKKNHLAQQHLLYALNMTCKPVREV